MVEILRGAFLDDAALVHHRDPVGHGHRLFLVVRHINGGDRQAALQVADFLPHLDPQLRIQIGKRLVEKQDARLDDDRARERHPLLLAAR